MKANEPTATNETTAPDFEISEPIEIEIQESSNEPFRQETACGAYESEGFNLDESEPLLCLRRH